MSGQGNGAKQLSGEGAPAPNPFPERPLAEWNEARRAEEWFARAFATPGSAAYLLKGACLF